MLPFAGNYLVGGGPVMETRLWTTANVQGNTLSGSGTQIDFNDANTGYTWTSNTFYRDSTATAWRFGGSGYTLSNWRTQSGLGSGDHGAAVPATTSVAVIGNSYETGRANIVVYNWGNLTNATVNVGGILASGDHYEVRNVQTLFGSPVATGTYNGGGSISVPLAGVTPTPPIGGSPAAPVSTGPAFNAFLLVKTN